VERFEVMAGLGHCPQDEAPEVVNPLLQAWVRERF
jgi:pimeloyl-ACP methyl ester carboxylesterase